MSAVPPASTMDPRIRARRIEVARTEGRRRLRRLAVAGGVLAGLAAAAGVATSPVLDVDRIRVEGVAALSPEAVTAASGIADGDALVSVDTAAAAAAVEELPWVASASVHRRWPGTIAIRVTERRPVAAVAAAGGSWVLTDASGRQLEVLDARPPHLPVLEGLEVGAAPGSDLPAQADGALALAAALPDALPVASVRVVTDGHLEALVAPPGREPLPVRFGPARHLDRKVQALAALLDQADLAGAVAVDVRVPGSPVVARG